jgi:hypothetical protein
VRKRTEDQKICHDRLHATDKEFVKVEKTRKWRKLIKNSFVHSQIDTSNKMQEKCKDLWKARMFIVVGWEVPR